MNKLLFRSISFIAICALAFGGCFSTQVSAASNTYYVSATGSDTNSGSSTAPFKTFAKAASVLAAGDTLQVAAGIYTETLTLSTSGTATAPITVIGNGAILNMQGLKSSGIAASGSYIHISNFEVLGGTEFGILITGKYVTVENNVIHDNVTENGSGTCSLTSSTWGSALKVRLGGDNTAIRSNTVYNNCGEGIAVTRGITALVENNTAYDNFSVNIYIDNSPFVTVKNNLSYCTGTHLRNGNRAIGIALGEEAYTGWGAQLHDILISNNTIRDCYTGIAAFESSVNGTLTNVTMANNIVPSGQVRGLSLQTLTNQNVLVSYNTLFNPIYVNQPTGVTLVGNTIGSVAPTSTSQVLPTSTAMIAAFTPTPTVPAGTITASPIPASPTASSTPLPAAATPTSILPTATVQPLPASAVIYDDLNGSFTYSPGWRDASDLQAYDSSYKMTSNKGAAITLGFTGKAFSILYVRGPNFRNMDVYIDGVLAGTINQRDSVVKYQQHWDYPGQLPLGAHILKLVSRNKGNTYVSLDAVVIQ
jgi:parallel beta-helix repeat protein